MRYQSGSHVKLKIGRVRSRIKVFAVILRVLMIHSEEFVFHASDCWVVGNGSSVLQIWIDRLANKIGNRWTHAPNRDGGKRLSQDVAGQHQSLEERAY